jgi:hypothetical protein
VSDEMPTHDEVELAASLRDEYRDAALNMETNTFWMDLAKTITKLRWAKTKFSELRSAIHRAHMASVSLGGALREFNDEVERLNKEKQQDGEEQG